ncbi:MAG: exodeoxyribonuclease VII small subunit [Clostridiales bacterium]|jgi:exodeoxyribonuclease VII small subunit|nr:exodeoxyribonuclease VII small subunit [Clostridiales bacterium]
MSKENKSLEASFEELENIIKELEGEDITLEESFKLYQDGMKLLKNCNEAIDKVEKQLIILGENSSQEA